MSAGSASHFFFLFWGLAGFFSFERVSRLLCESFELLVAVGCFFFLWRFLAVNRCIPGGKLRWGASGCTTGRVATSRFCDFSQAGVPRVAAGWAFARVGGRLCV